MTNPLVDILPPKYRRAAYGLISLAGLVYGAYTLAGGNWRVALGSLLASLVTGTAHANTPKPVTPYHEGNAKPDHRGAADIGLALLVVITIGVTLLLFRVHF